MVIIDLLTKIVYYKSVKTRIHLFKVEKVIIDVVVYYYDILNFIITNKRFFLLQDSLNIFEIF